jgi:hypothetical protein
MVEQNEKYQWEITLADNSLHKEADGATFNLAWESAGAVKKIEMKLIGGDTIYGADLTNGEFDLAGTTETPAGFGGGSLGDYALRFFRRNFVRMDVSEGPLGNRVQYFFGYVKSGQEKLYKVAPAIGQLADESGYTER